MVQVAHPEVEGGLVLFYGAGGTYGGFDRFGRIVDQRWQDDVGTVLDQFGYGYDLAGNRLWRQVAPDGAGPAGLDELYIYDGLHRLQGSQRGTLTGLPGSPSIVNATFGQDVTVR